MIVSLVLSSCWGGLGLLFGILPVGPGLTNRLGGIAAGDFMFFYSAGVVAREGRAADAYDVAALTAAGRTWLGSVPDLVWPYPPTLSPPLALLAWLPPGAALCVWVGLGTASLVAVGRLAFGRWRLAPVALLFPASTFALFAGQLSPVLALMLTVAILYESRRPSIAGAALGLLAWKPHFAIAPALLIGKLRAIVVAAITVAVLVLVSAAVFGPGAWVAFVRNGARHASVIVAETPFSRFVTTFGLAATHGLPLPLAFGVHALAAVLGCWVGRRLWQHAGLASHRAIGLVAATFLLTPYALDYDLVLLLLPWLLMIKEACADPPGAPRLLWLWLMLLALTPTAYLLAIYTGGSYGALGILACLAIAYRQERRRRTDRP